MNDNENEGADAPDLAAVRLAEIDDLSRKISARLSQMIDDLTDGSDPTVKAIAAKLDQLHAAHLKVLAAEDAFHAKIGKNPDEGAIDYDAARAEVGCRLDRLRESLLAEGVPCDPATRAACDAALSVRLLGDAPSEPT
jgi:hypothetical protein